MTLQAPYPYFGGKAAVAAEVWRRFGDVPNFVEPFFGSGAVLLARPDPHGTETVTDADGMVSNFWRAVRADPDAVAHHADWPVNECVVAGTLIATPSGPLPIEHVREGTVVLGERNGKVVETTVLVTKENVSADLYRLGNLVLTGNHPVWTAEYGYRAIRELSGFVHIARLDWPTNEIDLDMLYSPYEHAPLADIHIGRPANDGGSLYWRDLSWETTAQRTSVAGGDGRTDASGLLDTFAHRGRTPSDICCYPRWVRRWLARSGAPADRPLSPNGRTRQLDRWWGRISGLYPDTRTACQMVGNAAGRPICRWADAADAREAAHARCDREDSPDQYGARHAGESAREIVGAPRGQAVADEGRRSERGGKTRQAVAGGASREDRGENNKSQTRSLRRDRADLCLRDGRRPTSRRERGVGIPSDTQGLSLSRVALARPVAVYNFQTTTGNYFADGVLVHNCDLHARHAWLVGQRDALTARLEGDPEWYDSKVAGWWLWGICSWIGSGWCSGEGPWGVRDGQLVHLGNAGRGINRKRVPDEEMGDTCAAWSAHLRAMMGALSDRMRRVRVCSGDWSRVVGPTPTVKLGTTAVFLDPPYSDQVRTGGLYATDDGSVAAAAREWAIAWGDDPRMRIALAGYQGEHAMPDGWDAWYWKARGGYGSQGRGQGRANAAREVLWFSRHCRPAMRASLFDFAPDVGTEAAAG